MANILRDYQVNLYNNILKHWTECKEDEDPIFAVSPTASGKTTTFVQIIKDFLMNGQRTMLIAHREELITQGFDTLYANQIYSGVIMGSEKTNYSLPSQICSIQTIVKRKELPPADLIVVDEAHHVTEAGSYAKIFARYPNAKILMVSATPYRLSGDGFLKVVPNKTTKLIIGSTMKYLINQGWICPFDYYIASVPDMTEAHLSMGDYVEQDAMKAMEMAPIVESYFEHVNGKQGICFAINVAHSKIICDKYRKAGVSAEHIDGTTDKHERKRIFDAFKNGSCKVLVNCGITTEGTDLPVCEFVQLARPTKSLSLFLQMCGRASRTLKGLVDEWFTAIERRYAIASSAKTHAIILDNAGLWVDHQLPDKNHDWERYFIGAKSEKKSKKVTDEEIEMLVFVGEDENGKEFRTRNPKEIEGLKLIRVDKEAARKILNIKAIKEFDRLFDEHQKEKHRKKPGYSAALKYFEYCEHHQIFIPPEVWDYLERQLITLPKAELETVSQITGVPDMMLNRRRDKIIGKTVSRTWFIERKKEYAKANASQMAEYMAKKLNLTLQN